MVVFFLRCCFVWVLCGIFKALWASYGMCRLLLCIVSLRVFIFCVRMRAVSCIFNGMSMTCVGRVVVYWLAGLF